MKKKLGDTVLFTNQNVQGAVKQVSRAYVEHPKYPMTNRKAHHQALFTAAANFRRSFATLLDHSWQGQPYGINSLAHFMKLVTMNHGDSFPGYILQPKDIRKVIPQPWPLATGSIVNGVQPVEFLDDETGVSLNITFPRISGIRVKGLIDQSYIDANANLRDGDLLTFIDIRYDIRDDNDFIHKTYYPVYDRYQLDVSSNSENTNDIRFSQKGLFRLDSLGAPPSPFVIYPSPRHDYKSAAFGVIHSRLSANGKYYMRNNAVMIVAPQVAAAFDNEEYRQMCIRSYMDPEVLTSDWYLNQLR